MTVLCTADLHLTTSPHDEYRWQLFDWLIERNEGVDELLILGDMTNPKDNHSGILVNRLKENIDKLAAHFGMVILLYGNHDGLTAEQPFWKFIDQIKPNVYFINSPTYVELSIGKCLFVPAGVDWSTLSRVDVLQWIFTHATFEGAVSETGYKLTGVSLEHADRLATPTISGHLSTAIISGDIHKPQHVGKHVKYVGAPYHIRFGDQYLPRILKIDNMGGQTDLRYPAPLKLVYDITSLADFNNLSINPNQHAKIRVHLDRGELTEWPLIQAEIQKRSREAGWANVNAELVLKQETTTNPVSSDRKLPEQLVEEYAERHNASDLHKEVGKSLL
jgi:hypothetical protein